jgi:glycerophosphoryl diester phosphodiesterase
MRTEFTSMPDRRARHSNPGLCSSGPLLLGHRGARAVKSIPENTLASFDRCLADGCDGFEFDVRLTADGEAVVCHDPKAGRVTIARASAAQLPDLPRLDKVLTRYGGAFLDIELKVAGIEKILLQKLKRHSPQRFVVSSFLPEVLETLYALDSTIPLGLICDTRKQLQKWTKLPVVYVIPNLSLVDLELVGELQDTGKKVLVWTVNAATAMRRLAVWGVDGIISDNPKRLVEMKQEL